MHRGRNTLETGISRIVLDHGKFTHRVESLVQCEDGLAIDAGEHLLSGYLAILRLTGDGIDAVGVRLELGDYFAGFEVEIEHHLPIILIRKQQITLPIMQHQIIRFNHHTLLVHDQR